MSRMMRHLFYRAFVSWSVAVSMSLPMFVRRYERKAHMDAKARCADRLDVTKAGLGLMARAVERRPHKTVKFGRRLLTRPLRSCARSGSDQPRRGPCPRGREGLPRSPRSDPP